MISYFVGHGWELFGWFSFVDIMVVFVVIHTSYLV